MKTSVFAMTSLMMTFVLTAFYAELKSYYSRPEIYTHTIDQLKERIENERLSHLQTSYQFQEFRQYVATLLPEKIQQNKNSIEKSYPFRSLASVVQKTEDQNIVALKAQQAFERGTDFYRQKDYESAATTFASIVQYQPYFARLPETMFLLVDSYYNLKRYEEALLVYEKMLDVYPELEVTGYAMLLVGQIYTYYNKPDKAVDLYKTVLKSFSNPELNRLARHSLQQAEL